MLPTLLGVLVLTLPILAGYLFAKRNEPDCGYRRLAHYVVYGLLTGLLVPPFELAVNAAASQSFIKLVILCFGGALAYGAADSLLKKVRWVREWHEKKDGLPLSKWRYILFMMGSLWAIFVVQIVSSLSVLF